MTPAQADAYLAAGRTDAPTDYALLEKAASCLAKQAAVVSLVANDRAGLVAPARSLEDPLMGPTPTEDDPMPPEVTERILNALKEMQS